ncbi:ATP-binding cassette domain-containing protein [Spiroplasma cantharicola]|uniref:Lipopolysaccharide ABC transporter ATP-binding protein n=1 Tax=Spiroplasma cantharicola TaxID=362837 RepID=A0A0M5KLK5_9MOLU|nr:ABC transporter ATP-binding protein [Spiroplasma cantharicola]ALD66326.1 lipopolysaccharide ABC transporter ATP-binding protein [Spiroplasma cantharicola]
MIKISNLVYLYKNRKVVDISKLIIKQGEKIAIVGLNGAGKTTLVEIILKLKKPYEGEVIFDRNYISNAVFQDSNFISDINLREIFYLYCNLYSIKKSHFKYFQKFNLLDVENNKFKNISGGQQQKFKFLISLLNDPTLLVLDEISTSLDYIWRNKIVDIINQYLEIKKEIILLLISHDPKEIASICNRVLFMKTGKIIIDINLKGSYKQRQKDIERLMKESV